MPILPPLEGEIWRSLLDLGFNKRSSSSSNGEEDVDLEVLRETIVSVLSC